MRLIVTVFLLFSLLGVESVEAKRRGVAPDNPIIILPPPFFPIPPEDLPRFPPPAIKIPSHEAPLELRKMEVLVEVFGLESETTTTLTFYNPNGRVLEGELEFPLPNDATVSGYALDVSGQMIDGVIVTKEKARVVLETEIRRGVDPGIVEHLKGTVFRTRVYPIPANGERTVRIISVAPLALSKGDAAMHVPLPRTKLPALSLEVKVHQGIVKPEIGGFGNLSFAEWNAQWVAKAKLTNVTPDNDLYVNLPSLPERIVTVEEFKGDRAEGEFFVAISDSPKTGPSQSRAVPESLSIVWDASGSRAGESIKKDRELLKKLFAKWKPQTVELVVFRDRVEKTVTFDFKKAPIDKFFESLDAIAYDGATDFSALDFKNKFTLLFTDGLATLGERLPEFGGAPIFVIASASVRDAGLQRFLANATGGGFVDLTATDAEHGVELITKASLTLMRVEAAPGVLEDVQSGYSVSGKRATVYARLLRDGEITLVYGRGGTETARERVSVKKSAAKANHLLARSWAAARAMELAVFSEQNAQELVELGRRYNLVTPGTSLIVLERVSQYVEHGIVPPATQPQWREEYYAMLKSRQQQSRAQERSKIEQVISWWKARVAWWEKKPRYDEDFKYKGTGPSGGTDGTPSGAAAPSFGGMLRDAHSIAEGVQAPMAMMAKSANSTQAHGGAKSSAQIAIKEWNPATPYLQELQAKQGADVYASYLAQKKTYGNSPAYYLDCANHLFKTDKRLALRVLSNLAELRLEDAALLRVLAWRLADAGELDRSIEVFEKVRRLRGEEPQSYRDLALILARRLERDKKIADGVRAAEYFYQVILGSWERFEEVETIVVMELNHLLARMELLDKSSLKKVKFVDKRLRKLLDLDIRITLSWDADNTDLDLHVIEPSGEEAFYGHNLTTIGGLVSRDFTQGYGPEEYVIRKAMPGVYRIRTKYFGSGQQTLLGPVTVSATVVTNFGRPQEQRQVLTLRLTEVREVVDIGEITFGSVAGREKDAPKISSLGRDQLKSLKKGMSREAVVQKLGEPERRDGGALSVLLYRLADGTQIRLGFGPDLLWAKEVHDGAELSLELE